ncbi:MAG: hypothetical protein CSA21_00335 [Deltaproteobacteria bacterium]|nr:MAG: hypothetical protein CSA21_00335 [Deltaproteobacteria bacterium]
MARVLIVTGILCMVLGLAWPWLKHLPLGRLPGDIAISRGDVHLFFPVTTSILISLLLSLLFWLFKK